MNNYKIFLIIFSILLTSCSFFTQWGRHEYRARKAYERGDFDTAVIECARSLKYKRNNEKALQLMDDTFPAAIEMHHKIITRNENSSAEFKWDKIIKEYEHLMFLIETVENLNLNQTEVWLFKANVRDYQALHKEAAKNAAESHYQAAHRFMEKDSKDFFREAAVEFKKTIQLIDDYKDSVELYEKCRQNAIIRIAVMPFENNSGKNKFGKIGEALTNDIISGLLNDPSLMEFVEIVSRDQLDIIIKEQQFSQSGLVDEQNSIELGNILGVDQIITGNITFISVNDPQHIKNNKKMEREVVIGQESYTGEDGKEHKRNILKIVRAKVIYHIIEADAKTAATYRILDVTTARVLHSSNLTGSWSHVNEWATYTGNKEALNWEAKSLIRNNQEPEPSNEEMVFNAMNDLSTQLVRDIKNVLK